MRISPRTSTVLACSHVAPAMCIGHVGACRVLPGQRGSAAVFHCFDAAVEAKMLVAR